MAVGRTSEELIQALQDKEAPVSFDLAGLFEHVVLENMKLTGMYGRALRNYWRNNDESFGLTYTFS